MWEKNINWLTHAPNGDQIHNPGMYLDQESTSHPVLCETTRNQLSHTGQGYYVL